MEFYENRAKRPFAGFMLIWRAYKAWRLRVYSRRILQQMNDERFKDIGLRRDEL